MIKRPKGDFTDLVKTVEGVDIVPEHNMLSDLADYLRREKEQAEAMGDAFGMHSQLLQVLKEAGVPNQYDVLICDPPATESPYLYNAINATRSLVLPVEPSAKGKAAVEGLESLVAGLQENLNIEIGVLAALPTGFKDTSEKFLTKSHIRHLKSSVSGHRCLKAAGVNSARHLSTYGSTAIASVIMR